MAKRKRRQEWDDKIAAVQEEIDELMDEERRLLESLSSRKPRQLSSTTNPSRSNRAGSSMASLETRNIPSLANRTFSTNAPAKKQEPARENATNDYTDKNDWSTITPKANINEAASIEQVPFNETNRKDRMDEEVDKDDYEDFEDGFSTMNTIVPRPEPDFVWEQSSIVRIKAIQKLAIQQLTYRFLLRPSVAHDYSGLPVEYRLDDSSEARPNALLSRLRGVRHRLYSLKYIRDSPYDDLMPDAGLEELYEIRNDRERYDYLLKKDIEQCARGKITLQQLLSLASENLSACEEPDRPDAFTLLINFFTRSHQNDLSDMVINCLLPNLFKLSTPLIIAIVSHFRKTKNLKGFDLFLQMLRGEGGYPVNLRTLWVKRNVNGITVTVPPMGSFSPRLITSVITATLRFDQPKKAEAYMQVARAHGFYDNIVTLSAFLRFYGIRNDFENGSASLIRALNFMVSSSELEEERIPRLVLCMAEFSVRCGQYNLTATLLEAAVHSGFDCDLAYRSEKFESESNYLLEVYNKWKKVRRKFAAEFSQQQALPLHEKCTIFADLTAAKIIHLQHQATGNADYLAPTPTSSESLDGPQSTQPLPLKFVKTTTEPQASKTYPYPTSRTLIRQPVEPSAKIQHLRAQMEYLHRKIERLSLAEGLNNAKEDE